MGTSKTGFYKTQLMFQNDFSSDVHQL